MVKLKIIENTGKELTEMYQVFQKNPNISTNLRSERTEKDQNVCINDLMIVLNGKNSEVPIGKDDSEQCG